MSATTYTNPPDSSIDVIDAKLREAHALLDLIYCGNNADQPAGLFLESLDPQTLAVAIRAAMDRVEEARKALERLPVRHFLTDQVQPEVVQ